MQLSEWGFVLLDGALLLWGNRPESTLALLCLPASGIGTKHL
jgi:hypothetical protein